jgi:CheY-like chemotaxis protein
MNPEMRKKIDPASWPPAALPTILLVEDEAAVREVTREALEMGGYLVLEASGAEEAAQIVEDRSAVIDLLLTDVVMPGMSGRELSEELATLRPDMKILFMSGYTDDTVVRHGVLEEGMAFLQKPFTAESMLRKVRDVLDA